MLVAAAIVAPRLTGQTVRDAVRVHWPPLHADWEPRFSLLTLPAIAIGVLLWLALPHLAQRLSWRPLLLVAYAGTWVWTMALALTEGTNGLARVFERPQEYIFDAKRVGSISTMMHTFIERIPYGPDNWKVHVAGHPPGALLYFVGLDRIGVTDPFWIGVVCVTIASTAIVAVLITLRVLSDAELAHGAMPWIVLAPTAVWMGVSGDAVFTAVAAWGLALLAIAATSNRALPAVGAGLLLGLCVYLSYGLPLLGILALTVLIIARSWRPLPWALGGALVVAAVFTAAGFNWLKAYPVLVERYHAGMAGDRPYVYWVWANIAAWAFTVGVAVWAAFPYALRALRDRSPQASSQADDRGAIGPGARVLAQLAAAVLLTIAIATLSGMSKAEVERIFLPFTIWIVALPLLLPRPWHRPLLLSQVVIALCVQQLVLTRW